MDYHGKAGRLFIIPAETSHIYESDTAHPFSQYWIHFDLTPYDTNPLSASTLPVYVDVPAESPIAQYFENICKLIGNHNLSDEMQLKATLFALLAEYIRLAVPESDSTYFKKDPKCEKLLNYIQRHLDKDLSNAALAAYMHMSLRSFIRYFEEITGYTPGKYVTLVRMMTAKTCWKNRN